MRTASEDQGVGVPAELPVVIEAITRLNIGGPGRHVLSVAAELSDRYRLRVATGVAPPIEGELCISDVPVDRLPLVRAVDPQRDTASVVAMRRLLRRHDARLVHSHMAKAGAVARLAASSMSRRPRTVHTFHGHVLAGYFSSRSESVFVQVERRLARRTDRLIAVSSDVRDSLLDLGIGRPAQYEVVPLGVDLDALAVPSAPSGRLRRDLGLGPGVQLVGVAARLAPIKDHALLFHAIARLRDVHLAVLGDGELRQTLEDLAQSLDIGSRVHFVGWRTDIGDALSDLDVAVLTSRNEGTPMSLIEAAVAGVPVVATDVGGVRDVVSDGRTGLLVPAGDTAAVASALQRLLEDPDLRGQFAAAGRAHARKRFDMTASLGALGQIYDELLTSVHR